MRSTIVCLSLRLAARCAAAAVLALALLGSSLAQADPIVSRDINTYVLFAYDELVWKGGHGSTGFIFGGNIGVNAGTGITMAYGTSGNGIMSPGTQAVAEMVRADDPADIFDTLFANAVNTDFGATVNNPNPGTPKGNWPYAGPIIAPGNLPTLPFTPNRALTNGASNLTVNGSGGLPSPQTILPGAYKDVRFNDDSIVNLGAGTYDFRNLSMGMDVTINLSDATILRIDQRFDPNDRLKFGTNPGYNGMAHVYVGGFGDNNTTTRSITFSHGANIHGQFFAPTSWLDLGGNNELWGRFWTYRITGDPNNNVHMVVPEPTSCALLGMGAILLLSVRYRRRRTR